MVHRVYLVGGPARVGKSSLAQWLLRSDGIAWLPTDVLRTVLRRVLPALDDLDQGDVSAAAVGELMYPHIEQAVEVCSEEAERFLTEGPDIVPWMVPRLSAALPGITLQACFLGNAGFSGDDLASYCGPKPQHEGASRAELDAPQRGSAATATTTVRNAAAWYCPTSISALSASTQQWSRHATTFSADYH